MPPSLLEQLTKLKVTVHLLDLQFTIKGQDSGGARWRRPQTRHVEGHRCFPTLPEGSTSWSLTALTNPKAFKSSRFGFAWSLCYTATVD